MIRRRTDMSDIAKNRRMCSEASRRSLDEPDGMRKLPTNWLVLIAKSGRTSRARR